jgi:DNA-binding transcriptional ArsR family regulator
MARDAATSEAAEDASTNKEAGEDRGEGTMSKPHIRWDWGTAYDFFVSLFVLHNPGDYGLRPQWAAGVRARLAPAEREILEEAQSILLCVPLQWIYALPEPKDAAAALWTLRCTPAADRLAALNFAPGASTTALDVLRTAPGRQGWTEAEKQALRATAASGSLGGHQLSDEQLVTMHKWWARPAEFGERLLVALTSYQDAFFAQEERRIAPALEAWLVRARDLASRFSPTDLVEELSQGLRVAGPPQVAEWVLGPTYWGTPFLIWDETVPDRQIWLFGARPPDASLVPGEVVPDALLQAMKACADPTRLRILRILSHEALIPAELARRLRLRDQTVIHHLAILRRAGLVQIGVAEGGSSQKDTHATRTEAVAAAFAALQEFLAQDS